MNIQFLVGRTGKEPEVRNLEGGSTVARVTLATSERYTNRQGERVEQTEWHNLVFWGKLAEVVSKYVHKGSQIAISGKTTHREYETKDGEKRYITEVVVSDIELLGKKDDTDRDAQAKMAAGGGNVTTSRDVRTGDIDNEFVEEDDLDKLFGKP